MRSRKATEETIRTKLNFTFDPPLRGQLLARALREQGQSQETEPAINRPDIRRFIMRTSTTRIAIAALVVIGAGAVSVVGVNIGRYYYYGKTDDGGHLFISEDREDFVTMDADGVTDVEQTRRDLEEMKILSQQGKKELLSVKEMMMNGTVALRTHEYRYTLSDGRTKDMGECVKLGGSDDKKLWQEWWQVRDAGPGEDLGTYEETVENRVFSFKRERYVLSDGTEIIWAVGTPKDGQ